MMDKDTIFSVDKESVADNQLKYSVLNEIGCAF